MDPTLSEHPADSATPIAARDATSLRGTLYVIAAAAVGQMIQLRDGLYQTWSMPWLALAVAASLLALFLEAESGASRVRASGDTSATHFVIAAMVAAALLWPAWALLRSAAPNAYWAEQRLGIWFFGITMLVALLTAAAYMWASARRSRSLPQDLRRASPWLLGILVAYQLLDLATYRVGSEWAHVHGYRAGPRFYGCLAVAVVSLALMVARRGALTHIAFALAITAFAVMGDWTIRWQKPPFMDVWFNQTYAINHFLDGKNPYIGRYPMIFDDYDAIPPGSGPAAAKEFETLGFAYTPWSFWLELPAQRYAGDLRYAQLACMILTAVLIAYLRPGPLGPLIAMLYLFTPRAFFVLESAWTEPTVTFPLVLLLFVAARRPSLVPIFLGIFLVSKQYLVFAVAPALLLMSRLGWRRIVRAYLLAAVVGTAISLPLIVWDWPALLHGHGHDVAANVRAFLHCNFGVVSQTRMGDDVLSFLGWIRTNWGITLPASVAFFMAAAITPLLLYRCPRTPAGYAAAVGTAYLFFFATAHLVRCNYHYFVLTCFAAAAAATFRVAPDSRGSLAASA